MASKCAKRLKMTEEKLENKRNCTILALPDEILLKILSYLSTYDILKRVAFVCRDFERLSKDPLLINELYFFDNSDNERRNYFIEVVRRSKNLKKSVIGSNRNCKRDQNLNKIISICTQSCPKLLHLEISCNGLISDDCMEKIRNCENLQFLEFSKVSWLGRPWPAFTGFGASIVASMKNLRHINLLGCKFTDQNLIELSNNYMFFTTFYEG